jgi:trk system potassium uptake protein TrkA
MEILIIGAGKVGYFLAKSLYKKHNVTIVDKNEKALEKIVENLDVLTINKDIRDPNIFYFLKKEYDYAISVTNSDEINIISSLILQNQLSIKHSIIRAINTFYLNSPLKKSIKSTMLFQNILASNSILQLIQHPKINNIKEIPFSEFVVASIISDVSINPQELIKDNVAIIGVQKNEKFIFDVKEIQKGDIVYLLGDLKEIDEIANKINLSYPQKISKATIFGANELGCYLANLLSENIKVKIVEKDEKTIKEAINKLNDEVEIIHYSYEDDEILINENIHLSDVSISAFLDDEKNIIYSLKSKNLGIKKVITLNNNLTYYSIMSTLKLSTTKGPKIALFYEILEEIDSQYLVYERFFLGIEGKIFIKKIFNSKKAQPPKEKAKVFVIRENKILPLNNLKEGDIVIEFNFSGNRQWIETL